MQMSVDLPPCEHRVGLYFVSVHHFGNERTLKRILDAFREFRVGTHVFAGVDGYGHGDIGRETLDKVYARLFGAEAALVSSLGEEQKTGPHTTSDSPIWVGASTNFMSMNAGDARPRR